MNKLLTIAIPTYNRAKLLDRQLTWLSQAVKGFEDEIEIFVSDNCSTDNTQEVINKWRALFSSVTFNTCKNAENIGVMKNIMNCLNSATTKYVWTIGDDDPIQDRAISYTINKFKQYEDVSLLLLNFSGRNQITGEPAHPPTIVGNRWFDIESEDGTGDGKAIFEHCMTKSVGAVIFLTAIVYRRDLLLRAVRTWPEGVDNWMYLAYLAGYCAANGRTIVTKENYLECIVAVSYWQKEPQASMLMQFKHVPEVVGKLSEAGYSKNFYRTMMVRNFRDVNIRVFLGALRRWPSFAVRTLIPFLTSVGRAVVGMAPARN
ncbi:glycosyltransferase family 2 protein [Chryseolinea sp. H1M3-3]|uniref:glycosyltransferase family 2 protein n=1 Tax=Chryseolinea sp. H1M3-3 TaxID=3034144 RepID=UPI0023EDCCF0|nr:glycosyltransferase family 2 protein [Chryseolinea sp. H1M3-3]